MAAFVLPVQPAPVEKPLEEWQRRLVAQACLLREQRNNATLTVQFVGENMLMFVGQPAGRVKA